MSGRQRAAGSPEIAGDGGRPRPANQRRRGERRKWLCVLGILLLLTACGGGAVPLPEEPEVPSAEAPEAPPEAPQEEPKTPEELEEEALRGFLERMTLEEKVGQLFFAKVPVENALEDVGAYHLGGYLLFGKDTRDRTANELIQQIAAYQEASGIPLLIGVDEEGSTVVRVSSNPHLRSKKFSSPRKLWEAGLSAIEQETHEKDLLLRALGFNVNLNPVADVSTNSGDFIYDRTTGGDAETAGSFVSQVVEVQSRDGMGSVLKHFPGYGSNRDTHNGIAVDERPLETFREQDFLPFQAGFAAGKGLRPAVLVSHNIVNCMDSELPASLSPEVHRVLREDLGFDGVVMTDDLTMSAVAAYAVDGAVAVMALEAGNDLIITMDYRTQIPKVIEALENGMLEEEAVDRACLRVLRWKLELGLLENTEEGTLVRAD